MTCLKNINMMIIIIIIFTIGLVLITCLKPKYEAYCGVNRNVVQRLLNEDKFRKLKKIRRQCKNKKQKSCGSKIDCEFYASRKDRKENVHSPIRKYLEERIHKKRNKRNTITTPTPIDPIVTITPTLTPIDPVFDVTPISSDPVYTLPNSTPNSTAFN